jgi:hypothetical protein
MPSPTRYPRQGENLDFGRVLWFLAIPLGRLLDRRRPEGAGRYLA